MRVAVLFEYNALNGGEHSWLATVPYLQSAGVDLVAIAPAEGELAAALAAKNVAHVAWPFGIRDQRGCKHSQPILRGQLSMVLAEAAPDLVHANSLSMARTLGPLAEPLGLPCIGHLRDILKLNRQVVRDLNGNHRLLAVSEATRQFHISQGLKTDKTHVLYNGVDLKLFRPSGPTGFLHHELRLPLSARLIITIGQIGIRKGLDRAMDALGNLFALDGELHWIVVGQRHSQKEESIQFAESLLRGSRQPPFAGRVHWLGRRTDVPQIMREATLLLHTARQEPLGRVLLEASASGCPIVATCVGGTSEILGRSNAAAKIVPVDDTAALERALADLLADDSLCRQLGLAARARVETMFSVENAGRSLLRHYRQLAGQKKVRAG